MDIKSTNKIIILFSLIYLILWFFSCDNKKEEKKIKVNFSQREAIFFHDSSPAESLKAAVAAMVSPEENFFYYSQIFDYISAKIGKRIFFKQRKSYQEVNELLSRGELDFAFICSGAYIEAKRDFGAEILAIPKVAGKTKYYAYIIVHKDAKIDHFEDLKDHSFAFTDPLSNTGCLYPNYLMKRLNSSKKKFFSQVLYTHAHDYSIQAVAKKIVDGASVDSLVYDYLKKKNPQKIGEIKIIKKSEAFGMPPIAVNPQMNVNLKERIRSAFLNMNKDSQGKKILKNLNIDSFVAGHDKDYDSIRAMEAYLQKKNNED